MRKVLEYERQAAECRKLAAQMKIPEKRKQLEDMTRGIGSRVSAEWGSLRTSTIRRNPKQKNCVLHEPLLVGDFSVAGSDFSAPTEFLVIVGRAGMSGYFCNFLTLLS